MSKSDQNKSGLTLVEIVLAIALMGIISVGFISIFSSQLSNIVIGSEITVDSFDNQGIFEEIIYNTKTKIQLNEPLTDIPQWSNPTVTVLGQSVELEKLTFENPNMNGKESIIYLSEELANKENSGTLSVSNVSINVSSDPLNEVADLTAVPTLSAVYDDNSTQTAFYTNLFRWWRSESGVDPSTLVFPDHFTMVPVSQSSNELDDLLDNVGANCYVVLTVTPVDVHGFRGTTVRSSNVVYVKGAEWRVTAFPMVDMDNDYDFDPTIDHQLAKASVMNRLDGTNPYPDPAEPSTNLDLSDGSLFVPMKIDPASSLEPGNEPIIISGPDRVEWLIERNINLSKDFTVDNSSNISLVSGLGPNGGSVLLHPYVKIDASGDPVVVDGVIELLDSGVSMKTDGDIGIETAGKGNIYFYGNADLIAENVSLFARGMIGIIDSSIKVNNQLLIDNTFSPSIPGVRKINLLDSSFFSDTAGSSIFLNSPEDIGFKGGSWSSNQILEIPEGKRIIFERSGSRVNNLGLLDLGNTAEVVFKNSMVEDLSNQLRVRVIKESDSEMRLATHNYIRNIDYANSKSNIVHDFPDNWTDIGSNQNNIEFSVSILSGEGEVDDVKYAFDGTDTIKISQNSTDETSETMVRVEFRDKHAQNQVRGIGIFRYVIDASGNMIIEVEEEIPVDTYYITFDSKGGSYVAPMEKSYGDPITLPTDPTKPGYTFDGWSPILPDYMPDYDLNVEAVWTPNDYNLTLFSQGGTPEQWTKSVTYNSPYGSLDIPIRDGFTFMGWYTTPSGEGQKIEATDIYMTIGDQNLYARWNASQIIVSFNGNGGSAPSPSSKEVIFGEAYGELPEVTREGYTFLGWYTGSTGGSVISEDSLVTISTNHTLYAIWDQNPIPVTVTFDANRGTVNPTSKIVYFNEQYGALPTPTRNNHSFDGWFLGNRPITSTSIVEQETNHTLVADWTRNPSCPFIYAFDGSDFIFEHEAIPFAISRALETTSYGTLRALKEVDGKYHIKIAEELDEKSFTNAFSLKAVDYPNDLGIIDLMSDIYGKPHTIIQRNQPISFIDQDGNDLTAVVNSNSASVESSLSLFEEGISVNAYEATFDKPATALNIAKVMIKVQKTHFTTELGSYYLDKIDSRNNFWWMEEILLIPEINKKFVDFMSVINLKVDLWNGHEWVEQGEIKAGLDILEEFLIPIDLSQLDENEELLKIRLRSGVGLFTLHELTVDYSENRITSVEEMTPMKALYNGDEDVLSNLTNFEDNDHVKMVKGDSIELVYKAQPLKQGMSRGFIVALKGYYYMDEETVERQEVLNFKNKNVDIILKELTQLKRTSINVENLRTIDWLLNLIESVYMKDLNYKVETIIRDRLFDFK